jgi:hypothetical protein
MHGLQNWGTLDYAQRKQEAAFITGSKTNWDGLNNVTCEASNISDGGGITERKSNELATYS